MLPLKVEFVNSEAMGVMLSGMVDQLRDLSPVWPYLTQSLEQMVAEQFAAEGGVGEHGEWAPLSEPYATWKAEHYGDKPILQREGRLIASFQEGGGDHVDERNEQEMSWGSSVPYAIFHQTGYAKAFGGGRHRATIGHELEKMFTGTSKSAEESASVFSLVPTGEGFGGEVALALSGVSTSRNVPARRELDPSSTQMTEILKEGVHRGVVNYVRRAGAAAARGIYGPGEIQEMTGGEFLEIGRSLAGGL